MEQVLLSSPIVREVAVASGLRTAQALASPIASDAQALLSTISLSVTLASPIDLEDA